MNGLVKKWLTIDGVKLTVREQATHIHAIGQPGTGKSRALESWAMQKVYAKQGFAVLDPAGDLYDNLLLRISALAQRDPTLAERVVLMNPSDPTWTVGFNPLQPIQGIYLERLAWYLTDVIVKIWKLEATAVPRTMRLLTFSFLALAEFSLSLVDLPRFLTDRTFRNSLIARTKYRQVAEYFSYEFPKREAGVQQWATPVLTKIGPLIFDPDVRLMLGARSTINFRKILDNKLILLVNLSKGILGEGNSALLGAFVVALLQKAALSRADTRFREPFCLILDEFQNYTTDNIRDILSESRKYGLSLVLAHQYLDQLQGDLRDAVMNTAGTLACFRLGHQDGNVLARETFPPGSLQETHAEYDLVRLAGQQIPMLQERSEELRHAELVTQLTQLRAREFWVKRRGPEAPVKHRSLLMPEIELTDELLKARDELIASSGKRFGKLKEEVRKEMNGARAETRKGPISDYDKT